jgi:hypothetical protein
MIQCLREGLKSSTTLNLLDVGLSRALVDRREEGIDLVVFGKPCGHLIELFTQAGDGLVVHICLSNELGHCDWVESVFVTRVVLVFLLTKETK